MPRVIPTLVTVVAIALPGALVAGCGSSDSSSDTAPSTAAVAPPTTPADGQSDPASTKRTTGTVAITMKNIAFDPKQATARLGQKVVWTNDDTVQHNVVADSGATFESKTFGQGGTFAYTPTKVGTIAYECTLHPGMTGTLTVVK